MGNGLIWAALGKGIADAGSTFSNAMMQDIQDRRKTELEALREQRKMDMDEAREERKAQQLLGESERAYAKADQIGMGRTVDAVQRAGSSMAGDAPVASREEVEQAIAANPSARRLYEEAGVLPKLNEDQSEYQRASDLVQGATETGASSTTLKALQEQRTAVLQRIKEENRHTEVIGKLDERKRQFDEKMPIEQQKADAQTTAAGAAKTRADKYVPGGGGSGGSRGTSTGDKPATTADLQRKVENAKDQIVSVIGGKKADLFDTLAVLQRKASRGDEKAQARLQEIEPAMQLFKRASSELQSFKRKDDDAPKTSPGRDNGASRASVVTPRSMDEFKQLPSGTRYINPADGKTYIKK